MARRRFFVSEVRQGRAELTGDDAHHLTRVLRVEAGQIYEISDGTQAYLAEVATARKSFVEFHVREVLPPATDPVTVHLLLALIKFDRLEWALEKATELGVTRVTLVETARSEYGLERAASKRMERWRRILLESAQQSRRTGLPELLGVAAFEEALSTAATCRYFLDERREAAPLWASLPVRRQTGDEVALLVGPEGGWTEEERRAGQVQGWLPVSVGPCVLRAETAVAAGLAIVTNAWMPMTAPSNSSAV